MIPDGLKMTHEYMESGHCSESSEMKRSVPMEGNKIVSAPDNMFVSRVTPETEAIMSDACRLVRTSNSEDIAQEGAQARGGTKRL